MKYWSFALVALAVSGCGGASVKDTLGLNRTAPDEYRVVSRPPLSVPPQFGLRPPSATDTAPGMVPASAQAQSIMTGGTPYTGSMLADTAVQPVTVGNAEAAKGKAIGAADSQFLMNAGAGQADPRVREQLVEERYIRMQEKEESSWLDALDWTKDKKDPMVDAAGEAERIQKNEDEGKPVTEGETPETKGRDTGLLGNIFGY